MGRRKRETLMCGCFWCSPYWGPGTQPRHVPIPLSCTSQGHLESFHSKVPLMRQLPMNSFPGEFPRVNFQQIPPARHSCDFFAISEPGPYLSNKV